jgi:tetratricopeptide (TPR) repeat protein
MKIFSVGGVVHNAGGTQADTFAATLENAAMEALGILLVPLGIAYLIAPIASFFLGACYAAAGRDKEAVSAWERARAAQLQLPALQLVIADAWLRLGQPADALEPLRQALERQPQDDDIRRNLAVAQSHLGLHEQAYPTIVPFLDRNPKDADALMIALHALYQVRVEGKTLGSPEEDRARAATYARAYADAKGPQLALVEKWADFLSK